MMPVLTHFDHPFEGHTSPDLRRMEMHNRVRREEFDSMIFGLSPRQSVRRTGISNRHRESLMNRMRAAIGSSLIAAGNRIQSAH